VEHAAVVDRQERAVSRSAWSLPCTRWLRRSAPTSSARRQRHHAAVATAFASRRRAFMSGVEGLRPGVSRRHERTTCASTEARCCLPHPPQMFELLGPTSERMYMWRRRRTTPTTPLAHARRPWHAALMEELIDIRRLPWRISWRPPCASPTRLRDRFLRRHVHRSNYERLQRCETSRRTFFKPSGAPLACATGFDGATVSSRRTSRARSASSRRKAPRCCTEARSRG